MFRRAAGRLHGWLLVAGAAHSAPACEGGAVTALAAASQLCLQRSWALAAPAPAGLCRALHAGRPMLAGAQAQPPVPQPPSGEEQQQQQQPLPSTSSSSSSSDNGASTSAASAADTASTSQQQSATQQQQHLSRRDANASSSSAAAGTSLETVYPSSYDDSLGVQKNWFNALFAQLNVVHKTGTVPAMRGRQKEVFGAVEREFEGLWERHVKGRGLQVRRAPTSKSVLAWAGRACVCGGGRAQCALMGSCRKGCSMNPMVAKHAIMHQPHNFCARPWLMRAYTRAHAATCSSVLPVCARQHASSTQCTCAFQHASPRAPPPLLPPAPAGTGRAPRTAACCCAAWQSPRTRCCGTRAGTTSSCARW